MLASWFMCAQFALCAITDSSDNASAPADDTGERVAATSDGAEVDRFAATYTFVGGERERAGLVKAIESVVEHMSIFIRDIARSRLRDANKIPSSLVIRREARRITVSLDDRTYSAEIGAPPVSVIGSSGDALRLTHRVRDQRLIQTFEGERGSRINTFFIDPDGRLLIDVEVRSPRLPRDLRYRLSFGKQS
jgi:hypothetical protein